MKRLKNISWACLCIGLTLFVGCGDENIDADSGDMNIAPPADFGINLDGDGGPTTPEVETAPADALPSIADIATNAGTFTTLLTAVQAAGLTELLADPNAGPFTVFAPNDDAFAAVDSAALQALLADLPALTRVLQHHIVSGKLYAAAVLGNPQHTTLAETVLVVDASVTPPTIDGAGIIATDLNASNGYVHVIDSVLFPPEEESNDATGGGQLNIDFADAANQPNVDDDDGEEPTIALPSIAQLATNAGTFNTLLAAVDAAGLTGLLADANAGPFTVFAPNDAAFAAVDSAALQALLADVPALTRVLQHHIVAGKFNAQAVLGADEHTSLAETTLAVDATATPATIEGAAIIATDLDASNGYVHVIDTVIFPPAQ